MRMDDLFAWDEVSLDTLRIELSRINELYYNAILKSNNYPFFGNLSAFIKKLRTNIDFVGLSDREMGIDVDGSLYVGNSFLVLGQKQRQRIRIGGIEDNLDKLYIKYISDREKFLSHLLKNPYVARNYCHPAIKVLNEAMARLNEKISKLDETKIRKVYYEE